MIISHLLLSASIALNLTIRIDLTIENIWHKIRFNVIIVRKVDHNNACDTILWWIN